MFRRATLTTAAIAAAWLVVAVLIGRILTARVQVGTEYLDPPATTAAALAALASAGVALGLLALLRPSRGVFVASAGWAALTAGVGLVLLRFGHVSATVIVALAVVGGLLSWLARQVAPRSG